MLKHKLMIRTGLAALAGAALMTACSPSNDAGTETPTASTTETAAPDTSSIDGELAEQAEKMDAALKLAKSTAGAGTPELWTLKDEDTTVFIFGTVHLLPEDLEWRSDEFDAAFNSADTLVTEADISSPEIQQELQKMMMSKAMFTDGRTLSSVLDEDEKAIVAAAGEKVGMPLAALDPMKPWMASMTMSIGGIMKAGYDPNSGVEKVLETEAIASGKEIGFLETAIYQLDVLSSAPEDEQIEGLILGAAMIDEGPNYLDNLVAEWNDGDVAGIGALMANPDMVGGEELYDKLLRVRNENWVPQIEAMLDEPGTTFVAVGAGHLAGKDSVITMLENRGHTLTVQ